MPDKDERDGALREHLLYLLRGGGAHISFDDALKDFPAGLINGRVAGVPYTPWRVLEHMSIALWDIVGFCRDPAHVSPEWPDGYWPGDDAEGDAGTWAEAADSIRENLGAMCALVADASNDLYARIPHGTGQTLLREALLVADHNAYHLGVLVALRRALEASGDRHK